LDANQEMAAGLARLADLREDDPDTFSDIMFDIGAEHSTLVDTLLVEHHPHIVVTATPLSVEPMVTA
jgi:hypothetical protein